MKISKLIIPICTLLWILTNQAWALNLNTNVAKSKITPPVRSGVVRVTWEFSPSFQNFIAARRTVPTVTSVTRDANIIRVQFAHGNPRTIPTVGITSGIFTRDADTIRVWLQSIATLLNQEIRAGRGASILSLDGSLSAQFQRSLAERASDILSSLGNVDLNDWRSDSLMTENLLNVYTDMYFDIDTVDIPSANDIMEQAAVYGDPVASRNFTYTTRGQAWWCQENTYEDGSTTTQAYAKLNSGGQYSGTEVVIKTDSSGNTSTTVTGDDDTDNNGRKDSDNDGDGYPDGSDSDDEDASTHITPESEGGVMSFTNYDYREAYMGAVEEFANGNGIIDKYFLNTVTQVEMLKQVNEYMMVEFKEVSYIKPFINFKLH